MSDKTIFYAVVFVWVTSEIVLGIMKRAKGESKRDRGSLSMLWILIAVSIFLAEILNSYPPTRIPNGKLAFWIGMCGHGFPTSSGAPNDRQTRQDFKSSSPFWRDLAKKPSPSV